MNLPRERISAAIQAVSSKSKPALVGYLTAGFPTLGSFKDSLRQVALACDVVEIGVPFSDPMADGTTVQRASFVALQTASRCRGFSRNSSPLRASVRPYS